MSRALIYLNIRLDTLAVQPLKALPQLYQRLATQPIILTPHRNRQRHLRPLIIPRHTRRARMRQQTRIYQPLLRPLCEPHHVLSTPAEPRDTHR